MRTRAAFAEGVGTALLLAAIVGSGIMGERLANGNVALALLANSLATGLALVALILALAPVSGAHFNPLVTLLAAWRGELGWTAVPGYLCAQVAGSLLGVAAAHAMFGQALFELSTRVRAGPTLWWSEGIATFGLILILLRCASRDVSITAAAVAAYISAAYWFTASTSFANPAVTFARAFTNTFSGIRLSDVPAFIVAQLSGAVIAVLAARWMIASKSNAAGASAAKPSRSIATRH